MPTLRDVLHKLYTWRSESIAVVDEAHRLIGSCRLSDVEFHIEEEDDLSKSWSSVWPDIVKKAIPLSASQMVEHSAAMGVVAVTEKEGVTTLSRKELIESQHAASIEDRHLLQALADSYLPCVVLSSSGDDLYGNSAYKKFLRDIHQNQWQAFCARISADDGALKEHYIVHFGHDSYSVWPRLIRDAASPGRFMMFLVPFLAISSQDNYPSHPATKQKGRGPEASPPEFESLLNDYIDSQLCRQDWRFDEFLNSIRGRIVSRAMAMSDHDASLAARLLGISEKELS